MDDTQSVVNFIFYLCIVSDNGNETLKYDILKQSQSLCMQNDIENKSNAILYQLLNADCGYPLGLG